jgi:hypothetical protein
MLAEGLRLAKKERDSIDGIYDQALLTQVN